MNRFLAVTLCALPLTVLPPSAQADDRGYLTALLEDNLSGAGRKITITGFEGALSSQARIAELTIADDTGIWLTLREVVLDWNRSALLAGRVSVNTLSASEIVLDRLPVTPEDTSLPAPEASGFALPELPVSVNIGQVAAERIVLGETVLGQQVEARLQAAVALEGGEGKADLQLERTDSGPDGRVSLTAVYSNSTRVLELDLSAREAAQGIAATLMGLPGAPAVDLTVKGAGPLSDYTADLRLASDGSERLAGQVTLGEDNQGTRFAADLGGDLAPLFLPDYAEFFGPAVKLLADGRSAPDGRLMLDRFDLSTRALTLAGSLALAPDGLPERFDLKGQLGLDGKPVLLPLTTDQRTLVGHADLALAFDATQGEVWTADVSLTGLERADLTLRSARLTGGGTIHRNGGKPQAQGKLDFITESLAPSDAALARALGDALSGSLEFFWQEGADALSLPRLTLSGADYGFDGGVTISGLEKAITVAGKGRARADDLSRFAELAGQPLAGRLTADLAGDAALLAGSFDLAGQVAGTGLRIGIPELDNLLAGASTIDIGLRRDETGTTLRRLDLQAASLAAQAKGTLASTGSDLRANVDFADLSVLGPQYRGALNGALHLTGTPAAGQVTLDMQGNSLAMGVAELDQLLKGASAIKAEAGIAGDVVDLRQLIVNAASLDVTARGKIDPKGHDLTADLAFRDLRALGGGYRGALQAQAAFRGTPENGSLTATATGTGLAIGSAEADRLLAGSTKLEADLALKGGLIRINRATLANPQLSAKASGSIEGSNRKVDLTADLANLALLIPEFPGRLSIKGTAVDDGRGYALNLSGNGPGGISATVAGRLATNFGSADLAIKGGAQAALANAFISPRAVTGGLRFDLALRGPLAPASLGGRVTLDGLRISDPDLPYVLQNLAGGIALAKGRANLDLTGNISTGGTLAVTGGLGLAPPFTGDILARLSQIVLRDPDLYQTRLNGDLRIAGPLTGGARISGSILLNETELQVPSTSFGAASGLDDLRHRAEPADVRATRLRAGLIDTATGEGGSTSTRPFALDLTISAPQRIFVRGRGLDMELGGDLRVQGTTANVIPSGAFQLVRGRLDILGKRLVISDARLQLEGDFDPFLRVLASNESDGITSSVLIEGNVSEPKVSFVSQPELPEEEVLARLLFGRDLTSLSAFQAAQLAGAVATLAGKGGEGVMSKLRKGFGLDDLDISTNEDGEASLKAGKYISANTYTEVEVDQNGKAKISLNLDVTDDVTLRGAVGDDGGTSIGIFKEKDY
ncbi:translocation/assembly module TamB domain-containing protein [Gemmobacter denitrificans]|uniref:Translocation/assembly module TamB domain-containing protein n=1 Tax=Gemmobacter denitrificans TaxID=3123040 RepID=A0ABU8BVE5_9RHOB